MKPNCNLRVLLLIAIEFRVDDVISQCLIQFHSSPPQLVVIHAEVHRQQVEPLSEVCNMPPKTVDVNDIEPTAVLPLQDWLKLLSGRGVEMRVAMSLAAKMSVTKGHCLQ